MIKELGMDGKEELIDLTKMNQKDMLTQLYRDVQSIKKSISTDQEKKDGHLAKLDERIKALENDAATNKGVRIGLSLAVTILSVTAVAISVAAAFN